MIGTGYILFQVPLVGPIIQGTRPFLGVIDNDQDKPWVKILNS